MKRKLIQVNEGDKCPNCKKYTLRRSHDYEWINNNEVVMWDYTCSNCNAKFYEDNVQ
jgi:C4-type Zn-finger protein